MKRILLTGIVALASGLSLMAQGQAAPPKPQQGQGQGQAAPAQGQPAPAQGQPAPAPAPQLIPGTKSPEESAAVQALFVAVQSGNPDSVIKAAEELLTKFADTSFKETATYLEAASSQQKGDNDKAVIYGNKVLEMNPKHYQAALLVGETLAQTTRENDLDKTEKLGRAEKLLSGAVADVTAAAKPNPAITDAQWEEGKKMILAEAHNGLGLVAMNRKTYDVAVKEFQAAVDGDPQPAYQARLAVCLQNTGKTAEAVAIADKLLADPNLHPAIKNVATQVKNAAAAKK